MPLIREESINIHAALSRVELAKNSYLPVSVQTVSHTPDHEMRKLVPQTIVLLFRFSKSMVLADHVMLIPKELIQEHAELRIVILGKL